MTPDAAAATGLFERLRALRKRLADERQVPAYVVFSDRTLQAMAERKPRTRDEFLEVHGVGQKKLEEYGEVFLAEILRQSRLTDPAWREPPQFAVLVKDCQLKSNKPKRNCRP